MQHRKEVEGVNLAKYVHGEPIIRPGDTSRLDTLELQLANPHGPFNTLTVPDFLRELGDSPNAVAATLDALGIKGRPHKPDGCPIALAVQRGFDTEWAAVSPGSTTYPALDDAGRLHYDAVRNPAAVNEFIRRFDRGEYPYLIAGRVRRWRMCFKQWRRDMTR